MSETKQCAHVHISRKLAGKTQASAYRQCDSCQQKFRDDLTPWDGKVSVRIPEQAA